ncbi:MMPL family transporter [Treponema sp.]|uniref:efflux RND transporter permease subunit n=1 Tax=Treponema sp. TaxID=166 RepID=UPI0025F5DFB8|nr:MMPL family transporter [Treponema sp.]MCR5218415.1 MMPL family transporter [Treponema sp.]
MRITKINSFFKKAGQIQLKYKWLILAAILIYTLVSIAGLPKLKMSGNEEDWFEDWEQVKIDTDRFKEVFGSDDYILVMVEADDVFDPFVLEAIQRLGTRLEEGVPYSDEATSIITAEIPVGDEDTIEIKSPFEDGIPDNTEELDSIKKFILSRESLVNNIVSDDAKETYIILSLENYPGGVSFATEGIARYAQKIILEEEKKSQGRYSLKPAGMSYSEMEENDICAKEYFIRVLSGFIVMLLCLIIFVRSLRGVIVPLIATVSGIGSVLGLSAHLHFEADSNMITLPILLGMALSVGYSVHYVNSFRMHFRRCGDRKESVIKAVEETGWPILFTVITTIASLISFLFAGIGPIRWVGGTSASIVFSVYLYVIVLIPILMSFGKDKAVIENAADGNTKKGATKADCIFAAFGEKVINKRIVVSILSLLVILAMIPGILRITVNMDYTEMMGKKVPYVARLLDMLDGKLGSLYSYDVMIQTDDPDYFKTAENMSKLEVMENKLGSLSLTKISGDKARVKSACPMMKEINRMFNGDQQEYYVLPEDDAVIAQNLIFYCDSFEDWFETESDNFGITHLHVDLSGYDANLIVDDINRSKEYAAELFPDAKISIVGEVVEYAEMNHKLVSAELKSFSMSFIIIAILLILAFASIKTGLIGMIPNLAPVIVVGGYMGYRGFSLDMLTMTIMPMILGIAVDDTIHLINHIKYHLEITGSYKDAVIASFREIGKTMGMTTFILCAMFFMYMFSPLNCLYRIGLLAIIGLTVALVADYTLTPVLIVLTKPFGKEKNK